MYFQQTTYNHDYNKSPRVGFGDNSPRGGYYQESPRGDPRDGPRGYPADFDGTSRSPHHSPVPQRRQAPAESHRSYDRVSPQPLVGPESPRRYPYYDMAREDLPPINTYAINSTTQRDYGAFSERQNLANDIRGRLDPELARRYDKKYDSRPYFDEQDPPSFYRDLALTDRSGYSVERRAPHFDHAPLTDRPERNRRSPPPPRHAFDDMAKGQMKKEMDKIELHDANFKPYSHHNHGGVGPGVLSRPIEHHEHRYEDDLLKTTSPRRSQGQMNPAGGVFLLIRTDDAGFHDIKRAFELFTGDTPQRKLLGLATADMIDVKQGGAGWKRQSVVARWNGQYYNQERRGPVDKLLAVNWFPTAEFAKEWIDRDREFKHSAFPMPYGNQTSVLQLKYQPSGAKNYRTYMMMEFNSITNRDELNKYIDFLCKQLTRYQADIAFIDGPPVPIKSSILDPRAHVVCHRFSNKREADRFYNDVVEGRNFEHADVTTIVFSLLDIMKR